MVIGHHPASARYKDMMHRFGWATHKKGGQQQAAPNPTETAKAQGLANKEAVYESARVNQINEVNPWGTLTYSGDIGSPDRTRTIEYSPEGQAVYDTQQQIAQTLGDYAQNRASALPTDEFSFDQFGNLPAFDNDYRSQVQSDMFERLNPQLDRRRQQLETQLINQGITDRGSDAWKNAIDDLNRQENDLSLAISGMAGDEMSRLMNLQLAGRQQGINEYMTERSAPINELAAALQGSPAIGTPNFAPNAQYQVAAPDIQGLTLGAYNANANAAAQNSAASSAVLGNVLNAGATLGAGYFMSDIRLKKNIWPIGRFKGHNLYRYEYIWGVPSIGVIAQEVQKTKPEAVTKVGDFLAVNYGGL